MKKKKKKKNRVNINPEKAKKFINFPKPIRIFGNHCSKVCQCGSKEFFTLTCQSDSNIEWEYPDGTVLKGNPPKINGLVYFDNIISMTVCVNCNRLQNFSYPSK